MKAASRGVDGKTCFDVSHHQSFDAGVDGWWLVAGLKRSTAADCAESYQPITRREGSSIMVVIYKSFAPRCRHSALILQASTGELVSEEPSQIKGQVSRVQHETY
jgi:hypothetical protein